MSIPDIGIDLGTTNLVMTYGKKGVVLSEPSVIAYNKCTQRILAVGKEAYQMIGKTPAYIDVVRPIAEGVISDDLLTQCMIREFLQKVCGHQLVKPRIIICVPAFITELEKRAVGDAVMSAGCRKAYLIDEPIAAMLGAGINIGRAKGHMVVDIGGGTTDVAIVSMNGIVTSHSVKSAGNQIDKAIMKYMMNHYKLLIGEQTAEHVKKTLTNLYDPNPEITMAVKGRNILRGLPDSIEINEMELFDAIEDEIFSIMEAIKKVLEETPPELVGDIHENGILLTGGGALLGGLRELIHRTLNVNCVLARDTLHCVAKGTGMAFQKINNLLDGFEGVTIY
ncbi:MAG: rod shape-determining protein, partial [Oscillospiraceae bacterium]|nr:rod shape-determining protein [Oscillospiraceae bacterium]